MELHDKEREKGEEGENMAPHLSTQLKKEKRASEHWRAQPTTRLNKTKELWYQSDSVGK